MTNCEFFDILNEAIEYSGIKKNIIAQKIGASPSSFVNQLQKASNISLERVISVLKLLHLYLNIKNEECKISCLSDDDFLNFTEKYRKSHFITFHEFYCATCISDVTYTPLIKRKKKVLLSHVLSIANAYHWDLNIDSLFLSSANQNNEYSLKLIGDILREIRIKSKISVSKVISRLLCLGEVNGEAFYINIEKGGDYTVYRAQNEAYRKGKDGKRAECLYL